MDTSYIIITEPNLEQWVYYWDFSHGLITFSKWPACECQNNNLPYCTCDENGYVHLDTMPRDEWSTTDKLVYEENVLPQYCSLGAN